MVRPRATFFCAVALALMTEAGLQPSVAQAQEGEGAGAAPPAEAAARSIDYGTARLDRVLQAVRAAGPITLDAALDEPAWSVAPLAHNFLQNDPREGEPATFDTDVRVLYDDDALYFGVFAKDDEPGRIIVNDLKKDFNTDSSDGFRIILDTFHDERNGYQFATNPAGAKWDAQMSNEGRENNANWDGIWDVTTRVTETGWYAEIRIPFRTLKFDGRDTQAWGVNFERKLRRLNEDSYWSPLPRIYDIQRVSLAGSVEDLRGLRPGKNLRIKPFAASSSNTIGGGGTAGDFDAGVDVKYGVTTGLVWDFTVNTDFSQVEADEQQINLSRFNLFFPEKRDFFLDNSGIFQFGGGGIGGGGGGATAGRQNSSQELRLFFSRRIGLSDNGEVIPVLAGTRLSGRQGAYSMGVLSIQQREQGAVPSTNFTVLRVRRDILANSDVGAVLLNKEEFGPHFNRVAGVDANFRFGSFLTVTGYTARTFSPESVISGTGNEFVSRGNVNYQDRTWQVQGTFTAVGERFHDELGFVARQGVNNTEAQASRRFRPVALSKWVREIRPHWVLDMFTRQSDGALESRYQDLHLPFALQDSTFIEVGVNPNVEEIRAPFSINSSRGVHVNPGRYTFNEYFALWSSNSAARVALASRYSIGRFYDGYRRGYTVGPTVRLNENFNASLNLQINDIEMPTGSFVSKLLTTRVNYSFNTKMFVNALVQFNSDNRQWTSNLRFNLIHRPLSDFFLVYNERRDERTGDMLSRAVIAKMTYLVAF
jgi:uncharacterized protein DUF5916/cellulose/xylan binding protein with CBM9 domain